MLEDGAVANLLHRCDLDVKERLLHGMDRLDVCLLAAQQVRLEQPRQLLDLSDSAAARR